MKNNWNNLEDFFLTKDEIEYIRATIISANINSPETRK